MHRHTAIIALTAFSCLRSLLSAQGQDSTIEVIPGLPPEIAKVLEQGTPAQQVVPLSADKPLDLARELSFRISGDDDKMAEMQYLICKAYIEAGGIEQAKELAAKIRDYRSTEASLEIANALHSRSSPDFNAEETIALAEKNIPLAKPPQQQMMLGHLYEFCLNTKQDTGMLKGISDRISDGEWKVTTAVMAAVQKSVESGRYDVEAIDECFKDYKSLAPGILKSGDKLLDVALASFNEGTEAGKNRGAEWLGHGLALMKRSKVAHQNELLDAAARFVEAGLESEARKIFAQTEGKFGGETPEVLNSHYRWARLWRLRGVQDTLKVVITKSEALARSFPQVYRPYALAWAAAAWRELGNQAQEESCLKQAVTEAKTNVNPRMRVVGAIDICLSHAITHRSLPEDIFDSLKVLITGS